MSLNWRGDDVIRKLEAEMSRRLKVCAVMLQRAMKKNIKKSQRDAGYSKPGDFPHSDMGRLHNSIFHAVDGLEAVVGVPKDRGVVYGRKLEIGGEYTPRSRKYMAVPLSDEAKRYRRRGGSVWNFPKKLVRISRPGRKTLLVEKRDKRKWIIHYVLVKKVKVAPRPFIMRTLEENIDAVKAILGAPL